MEKEDIIKQSFASFMTEELLNPLVERYFELLENDVSAYFHRLNQPFAELLEEYYPNYFSEDYKACIGTYYHASMYGDAIEESKLMEIMQTHADDDDDRGIHGVHMLFPDSIKSIKYHLEKESVREARLYYDDVTDIINIIIIKNLNSGKIEF